MWMWMEGEREITVRLLRYLERKGVGWDGSYPVIRMMRASVPESPDGYDTYIGTSDSIFVRLRTSS